MTLWLASGSPRRAELLQAAGITLEAHATHADESRRHGVDPVRHAAELAERKARAAPADRVVLAADTVVHIGDTIFEKPADADDAFRMLSALSGATHAVTTGVCVRFGERADTFTVTTSIRFRALAASEIRAWIATGEAADKAGAYGIQCRAGGFVADIRGDYTNVVGLPLEPSLNRLAGFGVLPCR